MKSINNLKMKKSINQNSNILSSEEISSNNNNNISITNYDVDNLRSIRK